MTTRRWAAIVALLAITLIAGCARVVSGQGHPAGLRATPSFPSQARSGSASPSGSGAATSRAPSASASVRTPTPTPSGSAAGPTCPRISDPTAGISYDCLTTGMSVSAGSSGSVDVVLQTESDPDWYMSQDSFRIDAFDADSLKSALEDELGGFLTDSYPDGSKSGSITGKATTIDGKAGYLETGLITVDKTTDPDYKNLKANQDRVVAVAVLRGDGTASMLIIAVPDTQKDLWPKMDAIATSAHLL
jgi:hypothetical protein